LNRSRKSLVKNLRSVHICTWDFLYGQFASFYKKSKVTESFKIEEVSNYYYYYYFFFFFSKKAEYIVKAERKKERVWSESAVLSKSACLLITNAFQCNANQSGANWKASTRPTKHTRNNKRRRRLLPTRKRHKNLIKLRNKHSNTEIHDFYKN